MRIGCLYLLLFFFILPGFAISQKISNRITLAQGQTIAITMTLKTVITQEAMNQAIDFQVEGTALHQYRVTNITEETYSLHHQVQQLAFTFDGMGQKRSFDSNNEKDMNGEFGKPVKDLLEKNYDLIIDTTGTVLRVRPDSLEIAKMDDRLSIIANMLQGIFELVKPPAKGSASFFKVLPDDSVQVGRNWTESAENSAGKFSTTYTVASLTDTSIVLGYTSQSSTTTKATMMGNETVTTMNNKATGKIVLNRATGLLVEKTATIESNGSTEAMGGTLPVTSKSNISIRVNPNP